MKVTISKDEVMEHLKQYILKDMGIKEFREVVVTELEDSYTIDIVLGSEFKK